MGLVSPGIRYLSSAWVDYHSRPEVQIRDLAMRVRRRMKLLRLLRKFI
jgi:hypothetical protein